MASSIERPAAGAAPAYAIDAGSGSGSGGGSASAASAGAADASGSGGVSTSSERVVPSLTVCAAGSVARHLDLFESLRGLPGDFAEEVLRVFRKQMSAALSHLTDDALPQYLELLQETHSPTSFDDDDDGDAKAADARPVVEFTLPRLNLPWCSKLTSVGLQSIGPACTHLLQVDLSYCNRVDDTGVEAIAMNARRLQSINLTACRKVTDKGVQRVAVMCRNTLTAVCLELCVVTDVAVQTVVREVKHLADLNLGGCENVSNVGLQIVASHGSALVRLDLSGCTLTDYDLEDIGSTCFALEHLKLRSCRLFSDKGARHVAKLCNRKLSRGDAMLRTLDMGGCPLISDKGAGMLIRQSKGLQVLDLRGTAVTDATIDLAAIGLPRLRHLTLFSCAAVSDDAVEKLKARHPEAKVDR